MANQKPKSAKSKSAREAAAKARAEAEAKEKRRQRTINIVAGVAVVVVFALIVGGALWAAGQDDDSASVNPEAAAPVSALPADDDYAFGIEVNQDADVPTISVWEDFQCPACASFEEAAGDNLEAVAAEGVARLVIRPTTFLDRSLSTDHSARATAAYGCAVDTGLGEEYRRAVFANQPPTEGDGWTAEQLLQFGTDVGIEGEAYDTFETCFVERDYLSWAANTTEEFYGGGVPGTPAVYLDGEEMDRAVLLDPEALRETIAEASAS